MAGSPESHPARSFYPREAAKPLCQIGTRGRLRLREQGRLRRPRRSARLLFADPRDHFERKTPHLCFERLELQHEQFNAGGMEGVGARRHFVIAAN